MRAPAEKIKDCASVHKFDRAAVLSNQRFNKSMLRRDFMIWKQQS